MCFLAKTKSKANQHPLHACYTLTHSHSIPYIHVTHSLTHSHSIPNMQVTHSLTHSLMPRRLGQQEGTPPLPVLGWLLRGAPGVRKGIQFPHLSPTPGVLGLSTFAFPFWCPVMRGMLSCSRRLTCLIHRHRLCMIMVSILSCLQHVTRSNV